MRAAWSALALVAFCGCIPRTQYVVIPCPRSSVQEYAVDGAIATDEAFPRVSGQASGNVLVYAVYANGVPVSDLCSGITGRAFSQGISLEEIDRGVYLACRVPEDDVRLGIFTWVEGRPTDWIPLHITPGKTTIVWVVLSLP